MGGGGGGGGGAGDCVDMCACVSACIICFRIEVVTRFMSQCIRDTLHVRDYHFVIQDKFDVCVYICERAVKQQQPIRENRRTYRTHFYQP